MSTSLRTRRSRASPCRCPHEDCHSTLLQIFVSPCGGCYRKTVTVILRGCEEILSEGGSEGRERRIFGYTGSTLPTERRTNHRPRCATNRTVCAIGPSPAGVTGDPSLPPLGPTPLRISSQPLSRPSAALRASCDGEGSRSVVREQRSVRRSASDS